MEDTIKALRKLDICCSVMVGGAVLNEECARMVGADFYASDARDARAGIEWVCEMVRERLVAVSGSPPLKGQGIEKSVPERDGFVLRWHSEMSISSYCG
nr:hypothetical protein [Fonticella tunisiensis]